MNSKSGEKKLGVSISNDSCSNIIPDQHCDSLHDTLNDLLATLIERIGQTSGKEFRISDVDWELIYEMKSLLLQLLNNHEVDLSSIQPKKIERFLSIPILTTNRITFE